MADFGLVKSFDIDNGELDGLRPKDCFVLGYELAQVDFLLKNNAELQQLIHAENRERIHKSCSDAKRQFTLIWMTSDPSESWMMLHVKANGDKQDSR